MEAPSGTSAGVAESLADRLLFDRLAGVYAASMPPADGVRLRAGLSLADGSVRCGLDLGGGPGRGARSVGEVTWTVVDVAGGMRRQARRRGLAAVGGDATRLPVRDDAVDAAIVVDALHHMPDHEAVLGEIARVLRPGGVVVVREFDPRTVRGQALAAVEALAGFGSTFHTPDSLAALAERAGLSTTVLDRGFGYTAAGVA